MRIDVYQQHGKDHANPGDPGGNGCGCLGEPGTTVAVDVPCLPPVGSNIWIKGSSAWREVTIERYTFGDPKNPARIMCWTTYDRED